jgi:hypothetical protein
MLYSFAETCTIRTTRYDAVDRCRRKAIHFHFQSHLTFRHFCVRILRVAIAALEA